MKVLKRVVSLLMLCVVLLGCSSDVSARTVSKNGFTYDDSDYTVTWKSNQNFHVYTEAGEKLGTVEYTVGVAKLEGYNDYTLMVKLTMTPNNRKVTKSGSRKIYGLSEYVSIKTYVPGQLGEYRPVNDPKSNDVELSFGVDKEGASLGVSYTIENSDLDITAKCNSNTEMFYEVYDYKPSIVNPFASNKYVANESSQYGMAQFETTKSSYTFTMNIDGRFGASTDNESDPWDIIVNYVRKATVTRDFYFKLK